MTQQTGTAGTDLVQVAPGALALVKGQQPWTVIDLAEMVAPAAPSVPKDREFPEPAPAVKFTDTLRSALKALPGAFGKIMPTERRKLEQSELAAVTEEAVVIDRLAAELGKRRTAISEYVRTHQDHQARELGLVTDETIRVADGVAKGHYLIAAPGTPFNTEVPGFEDSWQQRYVGGKPEVHGSKILDLYEAGEIDRKTYLACTSTVRVFDQMKLTEYIRKNPAEGLALLRRITTRKPPSASLYPPKK
jgi:hypothetical protein